MRTPRVVRHGKPFPGVPGAILYTAATHVCDVAWPVGADACVAIEFPTETPKRYLVIDPLNAECVRADGVYRRPAKDINLVTRAAVSAFFAGTAALRRKSSHARQPTRTPNDREYVFTFKEISDPDFEFALPESLLRAAMQRPRTDFDDAAVVKQALANTQHTLVVPCAAHMDVLYSQFFAATPELERAAFNWNNHPFAAAVAKVCTRAGGPVQFSRGAFVFDEAFFGCLARRLASVLIAYLVSVRRSIWGLAKFTAVLPGGSRSHQIVFDTRINSYVDAHTRDPVHDPLSLKRRYVWIEPDELSGMDKKTKKTRQTLVSTFVRTAPHETTHLTATPVLPACMAHALHLESFPGLPAAQNDHYARARLAYLVHAIAIATGQTPMQAVDHSRFFASLRPDQAADYRAALKQGHKNKMAGPLCRNTDRDVAAKGLTCVKCPRACGRPNGIAVSKLTDLNTARPLTCLGISV